MPWRWVGEIVEFCRGLPEVLRAQRLLIRARRLRRKGHLSDAFRLSVEAFAILRAESHRDDPAAQALVAIDAWLVDQLAHELGHSSVAHDDLAVALQICEDVASRSPRLKPKLQRHIDWYRDRLASLEGPALH